MRDAADVVLFVAVLICVALILASCSDYGRVVRVIDGDTLLLTGDRRVRLLGIDAPEGAQTCFDGREVEYSCGEASRAFLAGLVGNWMVECTHEAYDAYGRSVALCTVPRGEPHLRGRADLAADMVVNGWALNLGDYVTEEATARDLKRGIWSGVFLPPSDFRVLSRYRGVLPQRLLEELGRTY